MAEIAKESGYRGSLQDLVRNVARKLNYIRKKKAALASWGKIPTTAHPNEDVWG